jgi:hypothetical protein
MQFYYLNDRISCMNNSRDVTNESRAKGKGRRAKSGKRRKEKSQGV